ncbi:MAG: SUMF1/EgtB/PvdO family nonheme iron enzyme [Planctomycetaceae bacterium]
MSNGADPPAASVPFDRSQAEQYQEAWARFLEKPVRTTTSTGIPMCLIPPGDFVRGKTSEEIDSLMMAMEKKDLPDWCLSALSFELNQHRVAITPPFYIGTTEVTQAQFQQVMNSNPAGFAQSGTRKDDVVGLETSDFPVENVSWIDAVSFLIRLSHLDGLEPFTRSLKIRRGHCACEPGCRRISPADRGGMGICRSWRNHLRVVVWRQRV